MYKKITISDYAGYVIAFIFFILLFFVFKLQVIESGKFKNIAEKNIVRIQTIYPTRGEIYDRKYRPIALNKPSYNLYITPGKIVNKEKVSGFVSKHFDKEIDEIKKIIYENRYRSYQDILLIQNIQFEKMVKTSEQFNYYPSLLFKAEKVRGYYFANIFTGYTGRITEEEYRTLRKKGYSINSNIGKTGLEKYYENILRGKNGQQILQVDASGNNLEFFKHNLQIAPQNGDDLILTIDNDLQEYVSSIFPKNKKGSIVVMNIKTGGILAYVSKPDFDPNLFTGGISAKHWNELITNPNKPMLDRIIHGTYPPGSVYKPIMASLGLEEKVIDSKTKLAKCDGGMWFGNRYFKCWLKTGHGSMAVENAIKYSCDVFFYDLSTRFSLEQINRYTKQNYLSTRTGIDLPGERRGFFPSRKWYIDNYGKYVGILGHKVNLAIGQGEVLVTPLQICAYYSAIGNDGIWRRPHLLDKRIEAEQTFKNYVEQKHLPMSEETLRLIQNSLYATVNERYGTGTAASVSGVKVSGKTGSAENHMGEKTHSWFSGYAKCDKFEIGFDVFVENGGHGGSVSAPIARKLINYYYGIIK
ncbi:MAG: penicillin-binding protein 2 [Candidatus Cloacimonadota bacterium]|nr:MAG: penicillin-binding protein 2 [Marinitoga sp. 4572_148]RLC57564.1 MAG: penicillin-binding protein 2 [Candidatus Cloacimonadota bacterium]